MTRDKTARNIPMKPTGKVWVPAVMIGALSVFLAAGLELLGWLGLFNDAIARAVSHDGRGVFPQHLPGWAIWIAAAALAIGLALAILATPGQSKRIILWLSTVVIVAGWAPVLSLAAHTPAIGAPCITTLWAGVCAVVYAANHRMACERPELLETPPPADDPS